MKKKDFIGDAYVSLLVIVWGTIGSLVDYPLLQASVYKEGSLGQISTFLFSGIICTLIGVYLFPKFQANFIKDDQ